MICLVQNRCKHYQDHDLEMCRGCSRWLHRTVVDCFTEIKEKSMSSEVAGDAWFQRTYPTFKSEHDDGTTGSYKRAYIEGHEDGKVSNELSHAPIVDFNHWWKWFGNSEPDNPLKITREEAEIVWNASKTNLGFSE